MADTMRARISEWTRRIADGLDGVIVFSGRDVIDVLPKEGDVGEEIVRIDIEAGIASSSAAIQASSDHNISPIAWEVWRSPVPGELGEGGLFDRVGTIEEKLDTEKFLEQAYRFIFNRELDDSGRYTYAPLLQSQQMSRRELLRILIESDEAKSTNSRYFLRDIEGNSSVEMSVSGKMMLNRTKL